MAKGFDDYPEISLSSMILDTKFDWEKIFGRSGPVHFEVGSGKATFLVNEARNHPECNFFGIEWCNKIYKYAVDRLGRHGLHNVRLIRADAVIVVRDLICDETVDCFHIYFPDPWPKKRHHKRRFISEANVKELLRCLKPGGMIKVATDHADYFEQIKQVLNIDAFEKIEFFPTSGAQAGQGEWAGTNFERKYLKEGRPIYTMADKKK
jgi:tRNA (guanine-N7-)-methyltransferase